MDKVFPFGKAQAHPLDDRYSESAVRLNAWIGPTVGADSRSDGVLWPAEVGTIGGAADDTKQRAAGACMRGSSMTVRRRAEGLWRASN